MKIAYILDYFPVLSETFIVREILELQKKKFNVLVFAQENTSNHKFSELIHNDTKKLIKDVQYFSSLAKNTKVKRWSELVLDHLYFFLRKPFRYTNLFCFSMTKGRGMLANFIFSVFYARKLQKSGIDHIHVHFALRACTAAMFISKISGIPYSFTVHAHDIFIPDLADMIEEKFNNSKFAVCISEFNKEFVLKHYPSVNEDKIKIIHCGLDLSSFTPQAKKRQNQFTILSIGRLVKHKGLKYLIEACKRIKEDTEYDFSCNIIGEGEERQNLERLIFEYGLVDIVHLLGSMEQLDVVREMESADIFVLPCVTEKEGMQDGIPVVLMEAMAMEIPVISTFVSGVPELIKDEAGLLVEQKDAEGLSTSIKKIMTVSDKEKEQMGKRGRAIVEEHFNIEKEVQKLAELINS